MVFLTAGVEGDFNRDQRVEQFVVIVFIRKACSVGDNNLETVQKCGNLPL